LGKNGVIYLLDRANLGGQGTGNGTTVEGIASARSQGFDHPSGCGVHEGHGTIRRVKGNGVGCPAGQSGELTASDQRDESAEAYRRVVR